ncbi:MAG: radical SAM family heme chaperone HemW [Bacteroidota bacterium]|nr:radical SAM family heme chaperone HemW [Bacteroidota bacterium]
MAGIYIHIPFCYKACHYCDFHFSTSLTLKTKLIDAICKELKLKNKYLGTQLVETIYFGGGTPSILEEKYIAKILKTIYKYFSISKFLECTFEVNPNDLTVGKTRSLIKLGVNRFSVGAQSFDDIQLKLLNRSHTSKQIERSIRLIQDLGVYNINIDLMYGTPNLKNKLWENNLMKAVSLNVTHMSCYCLTIEKGTVFHKMVNSGNLKIDSDDNIKLQFLTMRDILRRNNFVHYEISNFCIPSFESKHNSSYWKGKNYLGVGPSAHSFNGKKRHWNIKNNYKYIDALNNDNNYFEEEILTKKNIANEYILTNIRTNKGLARNILSRLTNNIEYSKLMSQLDKLINDRLIINKKDRFYLTQNGMILCDKITTDLFLA